MAKDKLICNIKAKYLSPALTHRKCVKQILNLQAKAPYLCLHFFASSVAFLRGALKNSNTLKKRPFRLNDFVYLVADKPTKNQPG